jgi:hypothetical protein
VRGKAVGKEQGAYAADGLKAAVKDWEVSSEQLHKTINSLLNMMNKSEEQWTTLFKMR